MHGFSCPVTVRNRFLARPWRFPFTDLLARSSAGGSGPVFPVVRGSSALSGTDFRTQRPTRRFRTVHGPVFGALEAPVSEQTRPRSAALTGGRSGYSGTLQGVTG